MNYSASFNTIQNQVINSKGIENHLACKEQSSLKAAAYMLMACSQASQQIAYKAEVLNKAVNRFSDEELLKKAVKEGNQEVTQILCKYRENTYGEPALYAAIRKDDYDAARILIKSGGVVEYDGYPSTSKAFNLQEKPPVINGTYFGGMSPVLWNALHRPNVPYDFVQLLIDQGANVNYNHHRLAFSVMLTGKSALVLAVENVRLDLMSLLIDAGANVNTPIYVNQSFVAEHSRTPLAWIAEYGDHPDHLEMAKLLLQNGADPNNSNPLYIATCSFSVNRILKPEASKVEWDLIKLLLENEADMDQEATPWGGSEGWLHPSTPYQEARLRKELKDLFDSYRK